MKQTLLIFSTLILCSCGTIGIGTNQTVNIHNDSKAAITATGTDGSVRIPPHTTKELTSSGNITLKSINKNCNKSVISHSLNTTAFLLDIIPGLGIGILVDAITDNLYKMPNNYAYVCE